jgi:hypothetical protein
MEMPINSANALAKMIEMVAQGYTSQTKSELS